MREISGEFFIFQQDTEDSAPAHRARETISLLEWETPTFISPDLVAPNSPDLNPVDYRIWGEIQQRLHQTKVHDIDELKQHMLCQARDLEQSLISDNDARNF